MQSQTILILHSNEHQWQTIHGILQQVPMVHIVGEARAIKRARRMASECVPDVLLTSSTLEDKPSHEMLAAIRGGPLARTSITVFAGDLHPVDVQLFGQLKLRGLYYWRELVTIHDLRTALYVALSTAIVAGTESIARTYFFKERCGVEGVDSAPELLAEKDQYILRLLGDNLTHDAIAQQLGCSKRTIDRRIKKLIKMLAARNTHDLMVIATAYGYLP